MRASEHDLLHAYRKSGLRARVHTTVRWRSAPLASVAELAPPGSEVLDFGCGHGLVALRMAQECATLRVLAVDIDPDKLRIAGAAARTLGVADRVRFELIEERWTPPKGGFDAVMLVDVLYLLPRAEVTRTITAAAAALRPGGHLVVKEMADRPRWKRQLAFMQEQCSVRMLGITDGQVVRLPAERDMRSAMEAQGLEIDRVDLGRHSLHPHLLLVGRGPMEPPRPPSPATR